MSQSMVTIRLNGTPYQIGCGEGEEAHIEALASDIETILQSLVASVGQIGEARLLAMAALILADRAHDGGADAPPFQAGHCRLHPVLRRLPRLGGLCRQGDQEKRCERRNRPSCAMPLSGIHLEHLGRKAW